MAKCTYCSREADQPTKHVGGYKILECCTECEEEIQDDIDIIDEIGLEAFNYPNPVNYDLQFSFCDDWLIFTRDKDAYLYYVSTEFWPAWLDLPEGADQEPNAVEKYMLPIAKKHWNQLRWNPCHLDDYRRYQLVAAGIRVYFNQYEKERYLTSWFWVRKLGFPAFCVNV